MGEWFRVLTPLAAALFVLIIPSRSPAQDARTPARSDRDGVVEVVATSRRRPSTWRYTFDRPADDWARPTFDDSNWKQGAGGFGTRGTPGAVVGTPWSSADVWLRRTITLPSAGTDPATLQLLVYHDEDVEVYFDGVLAAREAGFVSGYEPVDVAPAARALLKPGTTLVLAVHCHQTVGGQGVDVGLASVPPDYAARRAAARRRDRYRAFAMSRRGDSAAGERLFRNEQRVACARCHTTDGSSSKAGPDLHAAGDAFSRRDLVDAVLSPSANIAVGYSTTIVKASSGEVYDGVVKDAAADGTVTLVGADGKRLTLRPDQVAQRRTSDVSLMPEGLESGVSEQEFADLVDYLVSLKLPANLAATRAGTPAEIPVLSPPVPVVPLCAEQHRFDHPTAMVALPGRPGAFLVTEHESGKVWLFEARGDAQSKTLFGDFRGEIRPGGASGLLGIALHPRFAENHKYYLQHERTGDDGRLYAFVSEKRASPDHRSDSGSPSRPILRMLCTTGDHVGGGIEFGPDGMLYVGMGDTGPQQDPQGHGQDMTVLLGKMLRVDVDHAEGGNAYAVPADNPFRNTPGARPEIWALGFREPWRFTFDPPTGDLWVGDVGQDQYEEVSVVRRGENLGWNTYEGFEPFSNRYRRPGERYTPPVFAYTRKYGNSITGGYVYRGDASSPWYGTYICGDYTSRRVWAITQKDRTLRSIMQIALAPERISSFARDERGELYVVGYEGLIYRINLRDASHP